MKKIVKLIFLYFIILFSEIGFSKIKISTFPEKPIKNSEFKIVFDVETSISNDLPRLTFSLSGIDIINKDYKKLNKTSTFINGRLTTRVLHRFSYDAISSESGYFYVRNAKVKINNNIISSKSYKIEILKSLKQLPEFFVVAELDKNTIVLGEGVNVNYYLYYRKSIVGVPDIDKFPKLNNFVKRYIQNTENPRRVSYNGQIYFRRVMYAARLYPQKIGKLYIDPLVIRLQINNTSNSNYSLGTLGISKYSIKKVRSKTEQLLVNPIPIKINKTNYTGLVGKTSFNLTINKTKFYTNEILEGELLITSEGLLEDFQLPDIFKSTALEEFDIKSNMKILGPRQAVKSIKFRYLTRKGLSLNKRNFILSTFDLDTMKFKNIQIEIPAIQILGAKKRDSLTSDTKRIEESFFNNSTPTKDIIKEFKKFGSKISPPIFNDKKTVVFDLDLLLKVLIVVLILLLLMNLIPLMKMIFNQSEKEKCINLIKKDHEGYASLHKLIMMLTNEKDKKLTLKEIIKESNLSYDAKIYFTTLVEVFQNSSFAEDKKQSYVFEKKYFNELSKLIG